MPFKLPRWFWVLAFLVTWPTLLFAQEPLPTYSATGPDGKVTLTAAPCKQHIWLVGWQVAHWIWRGKSYEACWRMQKNDGQQLVVILDATGEVATFFPTQFVKDEAI